MAVNLAHRPFLGEVERAEGGPAACALPRGGVGGQGWGHRVPWGTLVSAHAPQLCAQLALRCPRAGAGHGPRRTGA